MMKACIALIVWISTAAAIESIAAEPATTEARSRDVIFDYFSPSGGYGGPEMKYTSLMSTGGWLLGGSGGWILDGHWGMGSGAYGLLSQGEIDSAGRLLRFGYAGLQSHYFFSPFSLVSGSFGALVGGGMLGVHRPGLYESDSIGVVEPTASLVLNLTELVRFTFSASYRWTLGVELEGFENSDASGFTAGFGLQFGKF